MSEQQGQEQQGQEQTPPAGDPPGEQQKEQQQSATDEQLGEAGKQALREERKARRLAEKELEQLRQATMSETDKAVREAELRGRSAAAQEYGVRLARTEFDALAARRNPDFKTSDVLEYVDLSKMLDENGEPDTKALTAAVNRLVPEAQGQPGRAPDFNGGTRTPPAPGTNMNTLIRRQAGVQ